jgi:hexosaminidase
VPHTGTYTFHLASDDGSSLSLNGVTLIDNDGLHGMREKRSTVVLAKGSHRFILSYFQQKHGAGLQCRMTDSLGKEVEMVFLQEE